MLIKNFRRIYFFITDHVVLSEYTGGWLCHSDKVSAPHLTACKCFITYCTSKKYLLSSLTIYSWHLQAFSKLFFLYLWCNKYRHYGNYFNNSDLIYKYINYVQDIDYHLFKSFVFHRAWSLQMIPLKKGLKYSTT